MSDFPTLNSGAVVQYPLQMRLEYPTRVLRFADGTEQRFRTSPAGIKRWRIRWETLGEEEMSRIQRFFESQQGKAGNFSFVDPHDGVAYPSCSFDQDECRVSYAAEERAETVIVIKENLPE